MLGNFFRLRHHQSLIIQCIVSASSVLAFSTLEVVLGLLPHIVQGQKITWNQAAYAQTYLAQNASDISGNELENYAEALLRIEPIRQSAYSEIRDTLGGNSVPAIDCHRPESLSRLSASIQNIARNYCNQAIDIVEENDLSIERFNEITIILNQAGSGSSVYDQVQDALIRLQQLNILQN
jgi:hypothetical protein